MALEQPFVCFYQESFDVSTLRNSGNSDFRNSGNPNFLNSGNPERANSLEELYRDTHKAQESAGCSTAAGFLVTDNKHMRGEIGTHK